MQPFSGLTLRLYGVSPQKRNIALHYPSCGLNEQYLSMLHRYLSFMERKIHKQATECRAAPESQAHLQIHEGGRFFEYSGFRDLQASRGLSSVLNIQQIFNNAAFCLQQPMNPCLIISVIGCVLVLGLLV